MSENLTEQAHRLGRVDGGFAELCLSIRLPPVKGGNAFCCLRGNVTTKAAPLFRGDLVQPTANRRLRRGIGASFGSSQEPAEDRRKLSPIVGKGRQSDEQQDENSKRAHGFNHKAMQLRRPVRRFS